MMPRSCDVGGVARLNAQRMVVLTRFRRISRMRHAAPGTSDVVSWLGRPIGQQFVDVQSRCHANRRFVRIGPR
jgi:hypothetical protein